jgi:hypothetical protein
MRGKEYASVGGVARAEDKGEINHEGGRVKGWRGGRIRLGILSSQVQEGRMPKRVGEGFEAAFVTKAASLGLGVAEPWGDSERYDFILDNEKPFLRVQVKATQGRNYRSYVVNSHHSERRHSKPYTKKDIDFLVAYAAPLQRWHLVPVEALKEYHASRIFPKESRYARFERIARLGTCCGHSGERHE